MKDINRPLTKAMIAQLQLARAKELSVHSESVITSDDFKGTLKGLYQRGYVNTHKINVNGKQIEGVYLTFAGVNFLSKHDANVIQKEFEG